MLTIRDPCLMVAICGGFVIYHVNPIREVTTRVPPRRAVVTPSAARNDVTFTISAAPPDAPPIPELWYENQRIIAPFIEGEDEPGLNANELAGIIHSRPSTSELQNANQCTICLDGFDDIEIVSKMDCSHIFHHSCIVNWLKRKPTCPICRFRFRIFIRL